MDGCVNVSENICPANLKNPETAALAGDTTPEVALCRTPRCSCFPLSLCYTAGGSACQGIYVLFHLSAYFFFAFSRILLVLQTRKVRFRDASVGASDAGSRRLPWINSPWRAMGESAIGHSHGASFLLCRLDISRESNFEENESKMPIATMSVNTRVAGTFLCILRFLTKCSAHRPAPLFCISLYSYGIRAPPL